MITAAIRNVELVPVAGEDRAFLFQVFATTRERELAFAPWSDEQKQDFLRMQFEAQDRDYRSNYPQAQFLLIREEGDPIGRIYLDRRQDEIRILDIALLPEHRGRGIGSQLLSAVHAQAAAAGLAVRLHVEHYNLARQLYERMGYRVLSDDGVYLFMECFPCS